MDIRNDSAVVLVPIPIDYLGATYEVRVSSFMCDLSSDVVTTVVNSRESVWLIDSLIHWPVDSLNCLLIDQLEFDRSIDWLYNWLFDWLIDWLSHQLYEIWFCSAACRELQSPTGGGDSDQHQSGLPEHLAYRTQHLHAVRLPDQRNAPKVRAAERSQDPDRGVYGFGSGHEVHHLGVDGAGRGAVGPEVAGSATETGQRHRDERHESHQSQCGLCLGPAERNDFALWSGLQ